MFCCGHIYNDSVIDWLSERERELSVSEAGFEAAMAAKWAAERSNLWTYVGVHENSGAWSERRAVRTSVAMSDRDGKKRYHLE